MQDLTVIHIKPQEVYVVPGRNPRLDLEGIEELADSINENGVRNPIKVRPNTHTAEDYPYELVDGHRRLAACKYLFDTAEIEMNIPAAVVEDYNNEADILVEMMVSNDSLPFAPFEEATLYARLRDEFKMSLEQIGKRIGKSVSHIGDKLALLRADESVRKAVQGKVLSPSDANTIIRKSKSDPEKQKELVERVEKEGREAVIDQELKKGRMSRPLWELAENAHDQVFTSTLEVGTEVFEDVLKAKDLNTWIESQVESQKDAALLFFIFGLGQLSVFAQVSHLTLPELWDKISERLTGKK
jgi:ParB/RepB/Spo0J family partition protein